MNPLTPIQRRAAWLLTFLLAIARAATMAASPWDWDEMLFLLGLRDYDVLFHHPHPPGFPLFIAAAHLLQQLRISDFHALQALNLLAGAALFPVALAAFREMRFPVTTAFSAALILVCFPNVWFYGGTGFSDIPSLTLVLAAVALLLRGCRGGAAFIGGALLLAIAIGIRPQNLLIGFVPGVIGALCLVRSRKSAAVAIGVIGGAFVVVATYGAAAWATGGWERYLEALRVHQQYIAGIDSFLSPNREPLARLFDDFFIRPYHAPLINAAVSLLAALGLMRGLLKRTPTLLALATFGPFALMAWLFLDAMSASRFSIGYAPLIAAAACDGIAAIAAVTRLAALQPILAAALAAAMTAWTLPALAWVRNHQSPPVAAMHWIARNIDPQTSLLYVHESMLPFAHEDLPQFRGRWVHEGAPLDVVRLRGAYFVSEGQRPDAIATFTWPRARLWDLARRRYFDVSVSPMTPRYDFAQGWYDEESNGVRSWRWMDRLGRIRVLGDGRPGRLHIAFELPLELLAEAPEVTIRWNGVAIDRIRGTARTNERTYPLDSLGQLTIETSRVANLVRQHRGTDPRDLGLKLTRLEWTPDVIPSRPFAALRAGSDGEESGRGKAPAAQIPRSSF